MTRPRLPGRRGPLIAAAAVVLVIVAAIAVIVVERTKDPAPDPTASPSASPPASPGPRSRPTWGPGNIFSVDVSSAPLDPNSAAMIRNLRGQVEPHYNGIAAFNAYDYSASVYTAEPDTPKTTVQFYDCQKKGYTPPDLFDGRKQFVDVPIPKDAVVAPGTDKALSIWSPTTDQLWEFWVMEKQGDGWRACWGGRIDQVSQSDGRFPPPSGATATGIPMIGTMVGVQDAAAGRIDHAMGLTLIDPAPWNEIRYPAGRSDGDSAAPDAIPEGSRLRLDPNVDVDALPMSPLGKAIARAAQQYGFIVVDKAGAVAVIAESGLPEKQVTGVNPWDVMTKQTPSYKQLEGFPWDKMQVVRKDVGVPAGVSPDVKPG